MRITGVLPPERPAINLTLAPVNPTAHALRWALATLRWGILFALPLSGMAVGLTVRLDISANGRFVACNATCNPLAARLR